MSSLRQIEANRGNAQKSTGPTSVTGKAVSSMNALAKTAIYAQSLLLPSENLADLEQLIDEWYRRHNPASPEARSLVDDLIYGEWIKRRLRAAETQIWAYDHQETYRPTKRTPSGQTAIECDRRAARQALQEPPPTPGRGRDRNRPPTCSRTGRTPVPNSNTRSHFTPNWLRSGNRPPRPATTSAPGSVEDIR